MKPFLLSFSILVGSVFSVLAQPAIQVLGGGGTTLPSHGSVGLTLFSPTSASSYSWYQHSGTDVLLATTSANTYTVFQPGQYFVKVNGVSSSYVTISAEAPTGMNKTVVTQMLHAGIKTETDLLSPYAGSHGTNSLTYLDGMGRAVQNVQCQASPSGKDLVQPVSYDANTNRATKSYLPYTGYNSGNFHAGPLTEQATFYSTAGQKIAQDAAAYAQTNFENSPLATVLEQGNFGTAYQPGTGYTQKYAYRSNATGEVAFWTFNASTTQASATSFFPAQKLILQQVTNEEGQTNMIAKDASGRVLWKNYWSTPTLTTGTSQKFSYYVYDDKGHLVYEVPYDAILYFGNNYNVSTHLWSTTNWSFANTDAVCKQLMHYYQYDALDRAWFHRAPGADPVYTVYDRLNRPILTQDGEQRKQNQWSFVKYDSEGRVIYTGLYTNTNAAYVAANNATAPPALQTLVNSETVLWEQRQTGTTHGYSESNAFPRAGTNITFQILHVNYYDDYNFDFDNNNQNATPDAAMYTASDIGTGLPVPDYNVFGRAVATKSKVIGTTADKWLWNVAFYDEMGRLIQTRSNTHVPTYTAPTTPAAMNTLLCNSTTYWRDFTGKVLNSVEKHVNSVALSTQFVKKRYMYDPMGRLLKEYQQNNTDGEVLLKQLAYNELGQPVEKNLHQQSGQTTFLQSVDYTYTIRGRLSHLNNADLADGFSSNQNNNDDANDLFGFQLYYEDMDAAFASLPNGSTGKPTPRHDGKITSVKWRTNNASNTSSSKDYQHYAYLYNGYNEYAAGVLSSHATTVTTWSSPGNRGYEGITQDDADHITYIGRVNPSGQIVDDLELQEGYNAITVVGDDADAPTSGGYPYAAGSYAYNSNGNLMTDNAKHLNIEYNHLNLVSKITWKNSSGTLLGTMQYLYDAQGTMLQKVNTPASGTGYTVDYVGAFYYQNNGLQFFNHSEGRVLKKSGGTLRYEYTLSDHQGYARLHFADDNGDGLAEVLQENHYYPSGLPWEGAAWYSTLAVIDRFLLQEKEWQDDGFAGVPLAWYDFGARMYDPQLMTWWAQDPLYQYDNPYAYCGGDPVNNWDPDGRDVIQFIIGNWNTQLIQDGYKDGISGFAIQMIKVDAVFMLSVAVGVLTEGIGGAMLAGALMGGGEAAVMHQDDVLEQAFMGAWLGALTFGLGEGLGEMLFEPEAVETVGGSKAMAFDAGNAGVEDAGKPVIPLTPEALQEFANKNFEQDMFGLEGKVTWKIDGPTSERFPGITRGNMTTGKSTIYVHNSAFSSADRLSITVGHEIQHAQDFAFGDMLKWSRTYDAKYTNLLDHKGQPISASEAISERNAYDWSMTKSQFTKSMSQYYPDMYNKYNYYQKLIQRFYPY